MRKVTLQSFQLFLAIFIIYATLYNFPNSVLLVRLDQDLILSLHQNLLVSLLCIVCIFLIGRLKGIQYVSHKIPAYRKPGQVFTAHATG